jgi:hypothetical protein
MAILYRADIRPSKLEMVSRWLPNRPWYHGPATPEFRQLAAYRFDDPAGEVGVETLIVRSGDGPMLQVPLTYRGAPLDRADDWLLGTMEHSVLGRRWVYDACGDPVYASTLAAVIRTGTGQADELVDVDGELRRREPAIAVRGSGSAAAITPVDLIRVDDDTDPTVILTDTLELAVFRVLDGAYRPDDDRLTLTGSWTADPDADEVLLATAAT